MPPGWHMIDEADLAGMVADHAGLARLCVELERVADALPTLPDDDAAQQLREELEQRLPTHDARERALLAALFGREAAGPLTRALLGHIDRQRAVCVVQGQDIALLLHPGAGRVDVNTFGYMLRCCFQSCRQAMAFEEVAILLLAGERLTRPARALLTHSIGVRCGG